MDLNGDGAGVAIPSLSYAWELGARMFRASGLYDKIIGVSSVAEMQEKLFKLQGSKNVVREIQYWGHGWHGAFFVGEEKVTSPENWPVFPDARWWFRTCATFGSELGRQFAHDWSKTLDCEVVGHTAIIGTWAMHSYGVALRKNTRPWWTPKNGFSDKGDVLTSKPWAPNTVNCLSNNVPTGWYQKN